MVSGTAAPSGPLGALEAAARPLCRLRRPLVEGWGKSSASVHGCRRALLTDLAEGLYFAVTAGLDAPSLCALDAVCTPLRALNAATGGRWRSLGAQAFRGAELDNEGVFEALGPSESHAEPSDEARRKRMRVDWKGRYRCFRTELPAFRAPFAGAVIANVKHPDEVAYCACRLRADILRHGSGAGVYIEVEVTSNPDNLSLAIVDFEAGGRSSVTFSPDTGAVIRERKVREAPRKVEGAYIQPLDTTPPGHRFEGSIGLYVRDGHLAFFRRCTVRGFSGALEVGDWECTGFIIDLSWTEGQRLTPCLAFRDEGAYNVRIVKVGPVPPVMPERKAAAYEASSWNSLDWEAGQPGDDAVQA